jgi:DNA-binding transcriptional MerR regulator
LSTPPSDIPDKLYFRIGEVAKLCGVEAYVLRFWESEFPQLRPTKSGTGQRLYRKRDVEMALKVRHLLYAEGFTIPGARQTLQQEARGVPVSWAGGRGKQQPELPLGPKGTTSIRGIHGQADGQKLKVQKLKSELRAILGILSSPPGTSTSGAGQVAAKERRIENSPGLFAD